MKAERTEQPQTIQTTKTGNKVKVWLRENIEQITKEEGEIAYQYDEYTVELRDRPNLEQYIETNFDALMLKAKQAEKQSLMLHFEQLLDNHINIIAQAKGYDNRITASLRAAATDSPWYAEGVAFVTWMDSCYAQCYVIQAEIESGQRTIPTDDEFLAEMPEMVWPE
jgi:hypothetical protein